MDSDRGKAGPGQRPRPLRSRRCHGRYCHESQSQWRQPTGTELELERHGGSEYRPDQGVTRRDSVPGLLMTARRWAVTPS
jgi:hypothetical protein